MAGNVERKQIDFKLDSHPRRLIHSHIYEIQTRRSQKSERAMPTSHRGKVKMWIWRTFYFSFFLCLPFFFDSCCLSYEMALPMAFSCRLGYFRVDFVLFFFGRLKSENRDDDDKSVLASAEVISCCRNFPISTGNSDSHQPDSRTSAW